MERTQSMFELVHTEEADDPQGAPYSTIRFHLLFDQYRESSIGQTKSRQLEKLAYGVEHEEKYKRSGSTKND